MLIRLRRGSIAEGLALIGLVALTLALYLWRLDSNRYANPLQSAAVLAGSGDWTAFLFGSMDGGNAITHDKPPAGCWTMILSVKLFGFSPWSILIPQALMGVATVATLYLSLRRVAPWPAALLGGTLLALTPVSALVFRYNQPDAQMIMLMTLATAATLRGVEDGNTRFLMLAGVAVGLAFLTKQLEAFFVLPGLMAGVLVAWPGRPGRRFLAGLAATGAMLLACGWWVALVELTPEDSRPYISSSVTNSFLEQTFGFNARDRLEGGHPLRVTRLLAGQVAGHASWLLPSGLILLGLGVALRRGSPRRDHWRTALVTWGTWLLVSVEVLSLARGHFHEYYTMVLAPPLAAVLALGLALLWEQRERTWARWTLGGLTLLTGGLAFVLLSRPVAFLPWLRWLLLTAAGLGAGLLASGTAVGRAGMRVGVAAALLAALGGPAAYTLQTVLKPRPDFVGVAAGPRLPENLEALPPGRTKAWPRIPTNHWSPDRIQETLPDFSAEVCPASTSAPPPARSFTLSDRQANLLTPVLTQDAGRYRWVAATPGLINAARLQLACRAPVMGVGGFNKTDPFPQPQAFRRYVAEGAIHYWFDGGPWEDRPRPTCAQEIERWVRQGFEARYVDGFRLFDLTRPKPVSGIRKPPSPGSPP